MGLSTVLIVLIPLQMATVSRENSLTIKGFQCSTHFIRKQERWMLIIGFRPLGIDEKIVFSLNEYEPGFDGGLSNV